MEKVINLGGLGAFPERFLLPQRLPLFLHCLLTQYLQLFGRNVTHQPEQYLILLLPVHRHPVENPPHNFRGPRTDRVTARHECRAAWGALRLYVEVQ